MREEHFFLSFSSVIVVSCGGYVKSTVFWVALFAFQKNTFFKKLFMTRQWWHTPLIPALRRQRQVDLWVRGQPSLQSEFQDSQGYTEKPHLRKKTQPNKQKQNQTTTTAKQKANNTDSATKAWREYDCRELVCRRIKHGSIWNCAVTLIIQMKADNGKDTTD